MTDKKSTKSLSSSTSSGSDPIVDPLQMDFLDRESSIPFEPRRKTFEGGEQSPLGDGLRDVMSGDTDSRGVVRIPNLTLDGASSSDTELQTQTLDDPERTGSATIVTSVPDNQGAVDNQSMTQSYVQAFIADPNATDKDLWRSAVQNDPNSGGDVFSVEGGGEHSGENRALIIGNSQYEHMNDLDGARRDAAAMAGRYTSSHEVTHEVDLKTAELSSAVRSAQAGLTSGDELLIYYAGHGISEGLLGTEATEDNPTASTMGYSELSSAASAAISGGWHTTIISDACESGALEQTVQNDLND